MDQKILWAVNQMPKTDDKNLPIMGLEEIAKARTFHESFLSTARHHSPSWTTWLSIWE